MLELKNKNIKIIETSHHTRGWSAMKATNFSSFFITSIFPFVTASLEFSIYFHFSWYKLFVLFHFTFPYLQPLKGYEKINFVFLSSI